MQKCSWCAGEYLRESHHEIRHLQIASEYVVHNLADIFEIHNLQAIKVCLRCETEHPFRTRTLKGRAQWRGLMLFKVIAVVYRRLGGHF